MSSEVTIRALGADDAEAYYQLRLRALHEHPSAFAGSAEEELPPAAAAERLAPQADRAMLGAFRGGALVGMAGVQRESLAKLAHKAYLWGVYVTSELNGQGVAKRLIEQALDTAAATLGVRQVILGVNARNWPALALYERLGFRPYGLERGFLRVDGVLHDEVQMACVLAERVRIRRARASDAMAVHACVRAAYAPWVATIGREPGPMGHDHAQVIAGGRCFVAERNREIAGVLELAVSDEGFLLDSVAVAPHYAGRGVGNALLRLAEYEARRAGHTSIDLFTHVLMEDNIARYRALGYAITGRREHQGLRRVFMRKALP